MIWIITTIKIIVWRNIKKISNCLLSNIILTFSPKNSSLTSIAMSRELNSSKDITLRIPMFKKLKKINYGFKKENSKVLLSPLLLSEIKKDISLKVSTLHLIITLDSLITDSLLKRADKQPQNSELILLAVLLPSDKQSILNYI